MGCDQYREALSADLDGEPAGVGATGLRVHLDGCAGCRSWYAEGRPGDPARPAGAGRADARPRAGGVGRAGPVPVAPPLVSAARTGLVVVAFLQALLAWSGALTGRDPMVTGHVAYEVGAWNLALAVAFLAAATRPRTAEALLAPVGVFVAVLAVSAVSDAVAGDVRGSRLAAHLLVAVGFGLLVPVARAYPPQPVLPPADGTVPRDRPPGPRPPGPVAAPVPVPVPVPEGRARPAPVRAGSAA